MNNLPQELVDHISSYLSHKDLKKTLLLSRKFQFAAEQFSEAFTDFALTLSNASKFISTYSGRRSYFLQNVSFATSVFSREDEAEEDCRDTANEVKLMDEDFTFQIRFLFTTLKAVETRLNGVHSLVNIHLTIYTPTRAINEERYCPHVKCISWRVHLLSPSTLPSLTSVRTLTVETPEQTFCGGEPVLSLRKPDLRMLLDISSRLPYLGFLRCNIGGDEWQTGFRSEALRSATRDWEGPRRDSRHDFGKALENLTVALPYLRHAQLDFLYPLNHVEGIDQRLALPNLTKPAIYDPFSTSLRILSYQLRTMNLRVVADKTLFLPDDGSIPSWPNLESINVMFHMSTSSGSWFFNGLPGIGATKGFDVTDKSYPSFKVNAKDYEEDDETADINWDKERVTVQYRVEPNEETLVPFLTAFATAAALMPLLKQAAIWSPLRFSPHTEGFNEYEDFDTNQVSTLPCLGNAELAWGVAYTAPRLEAFKTLPGEHLSNNRQIWWRVAKWRPSPDLHHIFHCIGRDRHGKGLSEYWVDDYAGEGLNYRDNFESRRWYINP